MSASHRKTIAWVFSTYFAEGLPYMIVRILSGVYFTDIGAKERYIGYLNFLGVPWNVKFLWASLLDSLSTKRAWMVTIQIAIGISILAISALCFVADGIEDASSILIAVAIIFVGMAIISATNDIAIDAYYLEGITDRGDQALYSGYRVLAYRVAMVFARSGLVAVAAWAGASAAPSDAHRAWGYAFLAGGVTMLGLGIAHLLFLPRFERPREKTKTFAEVLADYGRALVTYLKQDRIVLVLAFIIAYKLGDDILFSMVTPFLMRELGIDKAQYAWIAGVVGAAGTIAGAMLGGWWIKKVGLKRAIWPLTLLMNVNIWAYVWLAWSRPSSATTEGLVLIAAIHGYEQVAAGLGNAALLVFLLGTCKPEFKAAHYAIGSAIMSLGATLVGGFGGRIVEEIGYLNLFIVAFLASLPSMILLPFVPIASEEKKPD